MDDSKKIDQRRSRGAKGFKESGGKQSPEFKIADQATDLVKDEVQVQYRLAALERELLLRPESTLAKDISSSDEEPDRHTFPWFWVIVAFSILISNVPGVSLLLTPINQFVTMVHEMSHALATIITGGQVHSMTIVSDGAGHGGITNSSGGLGFIISQAGYLGTAMFGCLLVYLSQFPRLSRNVLMALGSAIICGTIFFILPSLLDFDIFFQAVFSLVWGLALGGGLIWASLRLKPKIANLVLLFIAVQTALNSLTLIWVLVPHSLGLAGAGFSDATNMQAHFLLPAIFWAFLWIALSVSMLLFTLKHTYGTFKLVSRQK
ncbi:MAG: M50 family metallopeptidase [Candidatus Obscuribacterales bacterium]|nr:M50 family metallopeptidase [Candidatus Obscuribacterales bacterium]